MAVEIDNTTTARQQVRLSREAVERWPGLLLAAGPRVIAPVAVGGDGETEYRELTQASAGIGQGIAGDGQRAAGLSPRGAADAPTASIADRSLPRISPKAVWFPRTEPILHLRRDNKEWSVADPEPQFPEIVIFAARPCDAAAPEILAPLFGWDFHDTFFEERRKRLAFIVLACKGPVDQACFCTSVGIDPAGADSGDVLLTELPDGQFLAEARSDRGRELLAVLEPGTPAKDAGVAPGGDVAGIEALRQQARESVAKRFDPQAVRAALERRFDDPLWERAARSCLACGTCAFACPTCHCFDIQDEMVGGCGIRQKNWDACAFPLFTLHTSGHNPRPDQASRWRQRLAHKFRYYPEKFGHVLCTGCGRCIRLCPGGMDLLADLQELGREAASGSSEPEAPARARDEDRTPDDSGARRDSRTTEPCSKAPVDGFALPTAGIQGAGLSSNIYRPYLMRIAELREETPDVRTLRLEFTDAKEGAAFDFRVGQFGLYSALGEGESTFCIASASTRKGYIECTFRQAGRVTRALRRLNVGDAVGFRGPYGNSFPVESWKGRDLLFIAGGIALPPMRSVIQYCLDKRDDFEQITIIYGARTWSDHVYKPELAEWEARPDVQLWLCIDWKPGEKGWSRDAAEEGWRPLNMDDPGASAIDPAQRRYTGLVPQLVEAVRPSNKNCVAVLCGPPIMIKFTLASLRKLGFSPHGVYTTLENRMKCGLGKCGRCNVGPVYVCKEGPVFTAAQVEKLPPEM